MTASTPSASALVTATVMPRSLNEPVGFWPSHFRYSSMPGATTAARRSARTRGVLPSFSVTTRSAGAAASARAGGNEQRVQEGGALLGRDRRVADPRAEDRDRARECLVGTLGRERRHATQGLAHERELVPPQALDVPALEAESARRVGRHGGERRRR